jgi:phage head maturation protease
MNTIPDLIPLYDNRPGLRSLLQVEVRGVNESSETGEADGSAPSLDFVASTATLDRYHEIIEPAGWRLDTYRRNPVFQNAHNYGDILFTLGKALTTEVRLVEGKPALCQRIEFATEVNPVARIAYGLYRGGFLNAVSVGFIPLKWEDGEQVRSVECRVQNEDPPSSDSGAARSGASPRRRYLEQELLEVSAVAIPANPDALALGVKSGAVAKSDLQETIYLLRALLGADSPQERTQENRWLWLARELRRVMQKA